VNVHCAFIVDVGSRLKPKFDSVVYHYISVSSCGCPGFSGVTRKHSGWQRRTSSVAGRWECRRPSIRHMAYT